jgi:hypothetical protein
MKMQKQVIVGDSQDTKEGRKEAYNTDVPDCIRRLSNGERVWLCSLMANVSITARIFGNVDEKNLLRAINAAQQMHPLLSVKVVFDDQHEAWFSTDNVPKTIFRTIPRKSETQWVDEIQQEYLVPFEPEIGPLIRFVLMYSHSVSELIVFAHHSICDGMSLANLIRDILDFYAEPAKEIQVVHPLSEADYPLYEHDSLSKPAGIDVIENCNLQWRKNPHYFTQADFNEIHKAYWEKYRQSMVLLQLEPEETSILVNQCMEKGVTITSASTIAFLAAYQDIFGPFPNDKSPVWIPYDLRRHLGENIGNIFCLCANTFCPNFDYNREKTFWENAQELHGAIRKGVMQLDMVGRELMHFDPTLINASNFASFMQLVPEAFERTKSLSAFAHDTKNIAFIISAARKNAILILINSNLGRLDFPKTYSNLRIDNIFFTPPASTLFPLPLMFGGVGFRGKLVFTLNYVEQLGVDGLSRIREKDMIQIRNRALEYLGFPEKASDKAYMDVEN